jgi:hypothetical protein
VIFHGKGPAPVGEDGGGTEALLWCTDAALRRTALFYLSLLKLWVLGVLVVVIFGSGVVARIAAQAGRMLRDLRRRP